MLEINKIYNSDCIIGMKEISDNAVDCVITSPPYNVGLNYSSYQDKKPYDEYIEFLRNVFVECYRVLRTGGRCCVNIGDAKNGSIPTHVDVINLLREIGFEMKTTIIWNKNNTSRRTAWGSYMSAVNPSFPRNYEFIIVVQKGINDKKGESTMTKEEFVSFSNGMWTFAGETKQKEIGHPAMFPIELPYRLIQMLTYKDDLVLDPFMGSGTTAIACCRTNRNFIGFELDETYFNIAQNRLKEENSKITLF